MMKEQAVAAVQNGRLVECTTEDYPAIREALQNAAAQWIDQQQAVRAQIALSEVKRLDTLHSFSLFKSNP